MKKAYYDITDESLSPVKVILALTWPLFIEQILTTLVSYADTAMVGALGAWATASVSISNPFVFLINGVVMALGVGITAYVARSVGAKDFEASKAYIRHALLILGAIGIPLSLLMLCLYRVIPVWMGAEEEIIETAADYLLITSIFRIFNMATMVLSGVYRGRGDMKTPLRINIGVNVINVVGNYLLINPVHTVSLFGASFTMWGAGLGVRGAALSTGFSWLVGGTLMLVMLYTKKDPSQISIRDSLKPDMKLVKRVVDISIPAMLERFCMSTASIVVTRAIASMGTVVLAANNIYITAESISFMPGFAFATVATTLVGQALGAKKPDLAKKLAYYTMWIGAAVLAVSGSMIYVFAKPIVSFFTPDTEVQRLATECVHLVAFIQSIQVAGWVLAGALRGAGDTRWPFYITAGCNWFIRTLGGWLCVRVFGLGLTYVVLCACIDSTVRSILTWLRFRTGKWQTVIKDS